MTIAARTIFFWKLTARWAFEPRHEDCFGFGHLDLLDAVFFKSSGYVYLFCPLKPSFCYDSMYVLELFTYYSLLTGFIVCLQGSVQHILAH